MVYIYLVVGMLLFRSNCSIFQFFKVDFPLINNKIKMTKAIIYDTKSMPNSIIIVIEIVN